MGKSGRLVKMTITLAIFSLAPDTKDVMAGLNLLDSSAPINRVTSTVDQNIQKQPQDQYLLRGTHVPKYTEQMFFLG